MADSSQRRFAMIDEVTPGTTPATPAFQVTRQNAGGMQEQPGYVSSDELRSDRNIADVTLVSRDYAGEIPFELSYGSYDSLIEKFLCSTWASNVIKNGVLHKTFTYEITDELGATDDYERYVGVMVNTMSLNIAARDKITGSFGLMAQGMSIGTAIIAGATYTAADTNPKMSGSADVGALTIGGSPGPKIMSISFTGTNNINLRPVVASLESNGLRKGRFEFTGTLQAYFDAPTLRDLQRANGYSDISIVLGVGVNKKYTILLPKAKLTTAVKNMPGNNEDIMLDVPFTAVYDATELAAIKITRVP